MSETASFAFAIPESARFLIELESRQDDLIRELDELNTRIERAIVSGQMCVHGANAGQPKTPLAGS